ncbi:aspartic proteinase nepenthesin-2-like [Setaria viridis]|uniref:aspartic proteinase nepenthesin-2-like n=1 Tax=Setaria viridis TaxID=4556 RepID=UPI003B3BC0C5
MVEILALIKDWEQGDARLQHTIDDTELEESFEDLYLDDLAAAPKCQFDAHHEDNSSATGFLVRDTFAIGSGNGAEVPGFLFGCAHRTEEFQSHGVLAGVLSLGRRRRDGSLVTELTKRGVHRFSYCLLGPRWPGRRGFLRFGDDAPATGRMQRTRIERCMGEGDDGVHNRVYSVHLAGVSVAGRRLPGRRRRENLPGISGCPRVSFAVYGFCLRLRGAADNVWEQLPTVTLHFEEPGVELVLRPQQMFMAVVEHVCLAVAPGTSKWARTIIGAMQQVDTRFTFDLKEGAVYLAPEQCLLEI